MKSPAIPLALVLAGHSFVGRCATNPVVPCATTTVYALVTDPVSLSFAPDGTLYTGRDNLGSGGTSADAVKIHRIGLGGVSVGEFGNTTIRDADAVVFDSAGVISGIPGSVIVGGVDNGVNGRLARIAPNGTVTSLFGPNAVIENPTKFLFTEPGRLLFTDFNNLTVMVMTNATPKVFCSTPDAPYALAQDGLGRILVSSATTNRIRLYNAMGVLMRDVFVTAQPRSPLARGPGNAWGTNVYFVGTNGALQSVSPAGVVGEHGSGFEAFEDFEFGPDGALYLSDLHSDVVLRVSPPECQPRLSIALLPGAVRLTWTTQATGYLLETNSALSFPAGWGVLGSNYGILGTTYAFTNALVGAAQFYRLHLPVRHE